MKIPIVEVDEEEDEEREEQEQNIADPHEQQVTTHATSPSMNIAIPSK